MTDLYVGIRMLCRTFAIAILALISPSVGHAQEVSGTLRRERGGEVAANVLVLARRIADGTIVARTLSAVTGRYRLNIGTDTVELVVLRIGYEQAVLARLRLSNGEHREISAALSEIPLRLATFETREKARCEIRPADGSTVANLFLQVRTALLSARLRAERGGVLAQYEVRNTRAGTRGQPIGAPLVSIVIDSALQPFRSVPADSLMQVGFRTIAADGTMTYRAPDADVLTSDEFLAGYCLQLVPSTSDNPAWIGVAFRPARERTDLVQIRGVAWLDRASSELRQIDFGYVGLEPAITRASPGGMIAYTRLNDDMQCRRQAPRSRCFHFPFPPGRGECRHGLHCTALMRGDRSTTPAMSHLPP